MVVLEQLILVEAEVVQEDLSLVHQQQVLAALAVKEL
jgi:hypothetical protein